MSEYNLALTQIFTGAQATGKSSWSACNFYDKVIFNCNTISPQAWNGSNTCFPLPGIDPALRFDGVTVFADHIILWSGNMVKHSDISDYSTWIPIGETVSSFHTTLLNYMTQPAVNNTVTLYLSDPPIGVVVNQFIRIDWFNDTNFYQVTATDTTLNTITCILQDLTGASAAGTSIPGGTAVSTIPANDAGEFINSGDRINGPILQIITLGSDAYIFKSRSIQLMQYQPVTGFISTTGFTTQPLITDEGLIGRYAWTRSTDETIFFLGNRELYAFSGGRDMRPVAMQHTKQVYAELDYANTDLIRMYHYEPQNEIWVVYPVAGDSTTPLRVLIYNYRWDTCTIDDYSATTDGAITAVGQWTWQLSESWVDFTNTWAAQTLTWQEQAAVNQVENLTVLALQPPGTAAATVNIFGNVYARNSEGYTATCETQDYDFGDAVAFKYIDTQYLSIEVLQNLTGKPFFLYVQLGARDNLDSEIRWSSPQAVEVSGNGMWTTKVNIRRSGRYIRARIYSTAANIQWKISSFRLKGRLGGDL